MTHRALRLLALCTGCVHAALIASSSLESCVDDGSHQPLECEQKMVVALSVENGQDGTEAVHATLRDVIDRTGTLGADDVPRELEEPMAISLSKSKVVVRYPVTYVQDVNAAPREVVVHHDLNGCVDGDLAANPSCGWVIAADGSQVPHSQGFCCSCSFDQTLGLSDEATRASSLSCDLFGNMESAHCLRMDPLWYSAFEIGAAEIHFAITVTTNNGSVAMQLGPHAPTALSPDGKVAARLVGDFAAYTSELELSGKMLLVPSTPEDDPRVQAGVDAWMLLGKNELGLRGDQCNLPGVAHEAFRNQANPCKKPMGSCLSGQLEDLYQEDLSRLAQGKPARYLVTAFGDFAPYRQAGTQYVAYTVDRMQASLVTLMLDAESIRFVTQSSTGRITTLEAPDFEAQSGGGELMVEIQNTGRIKADYTLEVACDPFVSQQHAKTMTISPGVAEWAFFELRVERQHGGDHMCTVLLKGALFELLDNRTIAFRSTERETTRGAQGGEPQQMGRGEEQLNFEIELEIPDPCDAVCTSFFDLLCFVTFGCSGKLLRVLLLVIVPFLVCCCCACAFRSPRFRNGLWRLCCECGRSQHAGGMKQPAAYGMKQPHGYDFQQRPQFIEPMPGRYVQPQLAPPLGPPAHYVQSQPAPPPGHHVPRPPPPLDREAAGRITAGPPLGPKHAREDPAPRCDAERATIKPRSAADDCAHSQPKPNGVDSGSGEERTFQYHPEAPSARCAAAASSRRGLRRHSTQLAYLNLGPDFALALAGQSRVTGLLSPGPAFSLRGRLVHARAYAENGRQDSTQVHFVVAPEDAQQHWMCNKRSQMEALRPPSKINRGFFSRPIDSVEKAAHVSGLPRYPCVNTPNEPVGVEEALQSGQGRGGAWRPGSDQKWSVRGSGAFDC